MSDRRSSLSASVGAEQATSPAEFSPLGWRDALRRTMRATLRDEMSLAAAGIAFYLVWALFPTLAVISVLGAEVEGQRGALGLLAWMKAKLPESVAQAVLAQLDAIVQNATAFSIAAL